MYVISALLWFYKIITLPRNLLQLNGAQAFYALMDVNNLRDVNGDDKADRFNGFLCDEIG